MAPQNSLLVASADAWEVLSKSSLDSTRDLLFHSSSARNLGGWFCWNHSGSGVSWGYRTALLSSPFILESRVGL